MGERTRGGTNERGGRTSERERGGTNEREGRTKELGNERKRQSWEMNDRKREMEKGNDSDDERE